MQSGLLSFENSEMLKTSTAQKQSRKACITDFFFSFRSHQKSKQKHPGSNQLWFLLLFLFFFFPAVHEKKVTAHTTDVIYPEEYTKLKKLNTVLVALMFWLN